MSTWVFVVWVNSSFIGWRLDLPEWLVGGPAGLGGTLGAWVVSDLFLVAGSLLRRLRGRFGFGLRFGGGLGGS
jgi:hypothetical protein